VCEKADPAPPPVPALEVSVAAPAPGLRPPPVAHQPLLVARAAPPAVQRGVVVPHAHGVPQLVRVGARRHHQVVPPAPLAGDEHGAQVRPAAPARQPHPVHSLRAEAVGKEGVCDALVPDEHAVLELLDGPRDVGLVFDVDPPVHKLHVALQLEEHGHVECGVGEPDPGELHHLGHPVPGQPVLPAEVVQQVAVVLDGDPVGGPARQLQLPVELQREGVLGGLHLQPVVVLVVLVRSALTVREVLLSLLLLLQYLPPPPLPLLPDHPGDAVHGD